MQRSGSSSLSEQEEDTVFVDVIDDVQTISVASGSYDDRVSLVKNCGCSVVI